VAESESPVARTQSSPSKSPVNSRLLFPLSARVAANSRLFLAHVLDTAKMVFRKAERSGRMAMAAFHGGDFSNKRSRRPIARRLRRSGSSNRTSATFAALDGHVAHHVEGGFGRENALRPGLHANRAERHWP